jgi:hypothetical protein
MRLTLGIAALAATFAAASPAFAQSAITDTAPGTARGVVLQTHTLENETDLDFGIVTTDGVSAGTVSIEASSAGARATGGGVLPLPSTFHAARFVGLAAPLQEVTLTVTPPLGGVLISASGAEITVNSLSLDVDYGGGTTQTRSTNSSGSFTAHVGGVFGLLANQPVGVYSGEFNLTATYE